MSLRYLRLGVIILTFVLFSLSLSSSFSLSATSQTKQSKNIVKIAIDDSIPPYSYMDKNGNLKGFYVDMLMNMERFTNFTFELKPGTWHQVFSWLSDGKVDALMGMVPTPQRNKTFLFTEVYQHLYFNFFQRANMPQISNMNGIANHTIAVVKDDISEIFIKEWMNSTHEKLYIVEVETPEEGLKLLNSNSVDLFLYEIHICSYFISSLNLKNVRLTNVEAFSMPIAIAVKKNEKWLVNELNYAIEKVKSSGDYTELYNKWFNPQTSTSIPVYMYFTVTALILSVSVIAYMGRRYVKAEKKVKAQNKRIENLVALSQTLMENMPIGILYVKDDKCIYANPEALKIVGHSFKDINKYKIFKKLMVNGEIEIKTKGGKTKWIFAKSINYGGGKIISLIDITDKKMLEIKELERFEFLNNMLDALRNPMQNILFAVEDIEKEEMQNIIKQEVEKISNILKNEPD